MKKYLRVRKRADFVRISRGGFCFRSNSMVMLCGNNGLDHYRMGFTASKKVGNAVVRNRCKRRMRAAADTVLKSVGLAGVDYVFIAKKRTFGAVWLDLVCEATAGVSFLNNKVFQCEKRQSV